jgi:hypothetical protein
MWYVAHFEVEIRIKTAILFSAADKDHNGTLSFEEYFSHAAKGGAVVAEMKAKLQKEFELIDKDKNKELDFEEMVYFYLGDPSKIEMDCHQGPVQPAEPKIIFSQNLTKEQQAKKEIILNLQKLIKDKKE